MTNEQIKVLEELLETKGIKGKKYLKHALWLNTNESKFKVGDYVLVTERNMRIYGNQVIDFKGKITDVMNFNFVKEYRYEIVVEVDGKEYKVFACDDGIKKSKFKNNHNVLSKKSEYAECINL